jgi:hypothetical protein
MCDTILQNLSLCGVRGVRTSHLAKLFHPLDRGWFYLRGVEIARAVLKCPFPTIHIIAYVTQYVNRKNKKIFLKKVLDIPGIVCYNTYRK